MIEVFGPKLRCAFVSLQERARWPAINYMSNLRETAVIAANGRAYRQRCTHSSPVVPCR